MMLYDTPILVSRTEQRMKGKLFLGAAYLFIFLSGGMPFVGKYCSLVFVPFFSTIIYAVQKTREREREREI